MLYGEVVLMKSLVCGDACISFQGHEVWHLNSVLYSVVMFNRLGNENQCGECCIMHPNLGGGDLSSKPSTEPPLGIQLTVAATGIKLWHGKSELPVSSMAGQ